VYLLFKQDFHRRYGPSARVLSSLDYVIGPGTGDFRRDTLLKWMVTDFKLAYSMGKIPKSGIQREGRNRKADVLGIGLADDGTMHLELVEVTTRRQAAKTLATEVEAKVAILNEKVIPHALEEMRQTALRDRQTPAPHAIAAAPSKWRPDPMQRVWPFAPQGTSTANLDWLCFWPTFQHEPPDGVDGLVLYEMHTQPWPQGVGVEVIRRIVNQLPKMHSRDELVLIPELAEYWRRHPSDQRALREAAVWGIAVVMCLALVMAPEIAIPAVAAEATADVAIGTSIQELAGGAAAMGDEAFLARAVTTLQRAWSIMGTTGAPQFSTP